MLRETQAQFKNPAVLWSTGKDSTTTLSLIREAFMGAIPWPVIHIDTGQKFPEIYKFRDKIAAEWGFNLIVAKNEKALKSGTSPNTVKRLKCCTTLKTEALKELIHERKFDAIVVSIRRDEHGIRGKERYMSPRDKNFRWNVWTRKGGESGTALQDTELSGWNLYESYFGEEIDHVRVHPILHWTELDVWKYINDRSLPFNLFTAKVTSEESMAGKVSASEAWDACPAPTPSTRMLQQLMRYSTIFLEQLGRKGLEELKIRRKLTLWNDSEPSATCEEGHRFRVLW